MLRVEQSIDNKKQDWVKTTHDNWVKKTPFIYEYHKEADAKLHT